MLRAMYNFDHCIKTPSPAVGAVNNPQVGFGYSNSTMLLPTVLAVDSNGFLCGYGSGQNAGVAFDMTGVVPANPSKVTFGFRLKLITSYASTHALIAFSIPTVPNDNGGYFITLSAAAAPWLPTVGNEIYVEVTYDFVAFSAAVRVNGVPVTITQGPAPTTTQKAAFVSGAWTVNFTLCNGLNARYGIRDFYVVDAVAGDGMVGPIGPQKMFPILLDSAVGAGWTPSAGGTVMDTLNAALPATPYVTSPLDKTPLVNSLKTNAPAGSRVSAVSLALTGTSLGDGASTSKVELSQGGSNAAAKFVAFSKTITYGVPAGLFPLAPDGAAWDLSKIDATTLKLTPDTAS